MALVIKARDDVIFTSGLKLASYKLRNRDDPHVVEITPPQKVRHVKEECEPSKNRITHSSDGQRNSAPRSEKYRIRCICSSTCGSWIATCDDYKQLCVWETNNYTQFNVRHVSRRPSRIIFSPKGEKILIADKSGDVYVFAVHDPSAEGKLLLGHVSMLLDLLITPDEKYIITCDRDEKIRVSFYPNAYNIHVFCMGHREFVTQLGLLPHSTQILISTSGDGTIILWNYEDGTQLSMQDCSKDIDSNGYIPDDREVRDSTNKQTGKSYDVDDWKDNSRGSSIYTGQQLEIKPAIKGFAVQYISHTLSLLVASIYRYRGFLLYRVSGEIGGLKVSVIQNVMLQVEPWDITFVESATVLCALPVENQVIQLFCPTDNTYTAFSQHCLSQEMVAFTERINDSWRLFKDAWDTPSNIPHMYKRWYDNMKDYMEKKRERLQGQKSQNWRNPPLKKPKIVKM